jgi:RNA polymerase-associated protein
MPPDPVMRARARLFLYNFEKELFDHIKDIESDDEQLADKARVTVRDNLTQLVPIFSKQNYLLGDDYSMLDVAVTPLLWRLDHYGIVLQNQASPILKYAERLFSRPLYAEAMTPSEKVMRK